MLRENIIRTILLTNHVFQANIIIFELIQDIIETNLLTKFHEDWTINVASRVLTKKNAPPLAAMMNLLTKFHEDWTINMASRVKNAPPLDSHVFQAKITIFKLIQDIIGTNFLTKFHEDRKINVASRVLTRKNAPPFGSHVFQPTGIIFELVQDIIGMNLLTKKNAPPLGSHVFQANVTIFKTHVLTKFHEDWTKNVTCRVFTIKTAQPPGGHVFSPILTIFKLVRDINQSNAKMVTSRVFTRNNARPLAAIFGNKCDFYSFNGTNVLTKFHEDQTINVVSRVFTRQNVENARRTTDNAQWTKSDHKSSP
ncbi:hypothetical protein DPMN_088735 [Dreissena polymorpha]|uniref:Uncharacterized protein n=1 Tax=Dreissena polymorpha TaxID=45954 RepID=A0A9D4QWS3_DREPO|nr:hypothetical protein DPMN_088735 [Dreissena polymorpha]